MDKYLTDENIAHTRLLLLGSFERYFKFMFRAINEKPVLFKPFHGVVCAKLDALAKGKNTKRNLLLNIPVGAGKSLIIEYFISWCFARNISNAFVYTSYNSDLILKLSAETKEICTDPTWVKLFGQTLRADEKSKARWSFDGAANRTGLNAKAMGGGITGLDAGNPNIDGFSGALIIDDPVDAVDGMRYPTTREECISHYDDKLATRRRTPTTPTILLMQRLHKEDLTGWILANEPDEWDVVVIPAMVDGESFWPERYPLEELEKIKRVNQFKYQAQYQQNPITLGGMVIKTKWFRFYDELPSGTWDKVFITGDTAQKVKQHNDFSVFMVWMAAGGNIYLMDMIRGKWEAPELLDEATKLWKRYRQHENRPCGGFHIEDKSSGTGLIQQLTSKGGIPVFAIPRHTDKLTRVEDGLPYIEAGQVYLPYNKEYGSNPDILGECENFTRDDSHKHDDMVDTIMDAINIGAANHNVSIFDAL